MKYLDKDYFDCPHCKIKNVTYKVLARVKENWHFAENEEFYRWGILHFNYSIYWNKKDVGYEEVNNLVIFQYPSGKAELPEYIPENIRKFYQEAVDAYNFGLLNSASI